MTGQWTIALAPLIGLVIDVFSQIVAVHVLRLRLSYSIVAGIVCGSVGTAALVLFGSRTLPGHSANLADIWSVACLTYLALAYGFWTFLNLNITSLRIRVLRAMLRAGGVMPVGDVIKQYGPDERLTRRLERLRNGKQIVLEAGRWRLNSWEVLAIARGMEVLRSIVMPRTARK
jgi:hypothetical protein